MEPRFEGSGNAFSICFGEKVYLCLAIWQVAARQGFGPLHVALRGQVAHRDTKHIQLRQILLWFLCGWTHKVNMSFCDMFLNGERELSHVSVFSIIQHKKLWNSMHPRWYEIFDTGIGFKDFKLNVILMWCHNKCDIPHEHFNSVSISWCGQVLLQSIKLFLCFYVGWMRGILVCDNSLTLSPM